MHAKQKCCASGFPLQLLYMFAHYSEIALTPLEPQFFSLTKHFSRKGISFALLASPLSVSQPFHNLARRPTIFTNGTRGLQFFLGLLKTVAIIMSSSISLVRFLFLCWFVFFVSARSPTNFLSLVRLPCELIHLIRVPSARDFQGHRKKSNRNGECHQPFG